MTSNQEISAPEREEPPKGNYRHYELVSSHVALSLFRLDPDSFKWFLTRESLFTSLLRFLASTTPLPRLSLRNLEEIKTSSSRRKKVPRVWGLKLTTGPNLLKQKLRRQKTPKEPRPKDPLPLWLLKRLVKRCQHSA
jgi:hypothetical protein